MVVGGTALSVGALGGSKPPNWLRKPVTRGNLVDTVTGRAELESASNINIKCPSGGGPKSIVEIVENGKYVKKGDHLVTLDTATLEDEISLQTSDMHTATAAKDQAEKEYDVAEIAVEEYEQGTFVKELQTLAANVEIAKENLSSAKNSLEHSERMFRKGYISSLQLEAQQFAVRRSKFELDSAETARKVLDEFTKKRMLVELQSKVQTAKSKMESQKADFLLKKNKLKRSEDRLKACTITAPKDGFVVYANDSGRWGNQQSQIEQGATVAEGKDILRLPDMTKMQVKLMVNETKVGRLQVDLPAKIRIQGNVYEGRITAIANQHQQGGWIPQDVKEYPVVVAIETLVSQGGLAEFSLTGSSGKSVDARKFDKNSDGVITRDEIPDDEELAEAFEQADVNHDGQLDPRDQLKPGMTAHTTITVEELTDVLKVPVTAIVSKGSEHYCWVVHNNVAERRSVKLGRADDSDYQVLDGVKENEEVIRNPRSELEEARQLELEAKADEASHAKSGAANGNGNGKTNGAAPVPGKSPAPLPGAKEPAATKSPAGPGGKSGGRRPDWKEYDKDGDGKVSKDEVPEQMRPWLERGDTNGDGFLDLKEQVEMRRKAAEFGRGAKTAQ